MGGAAVAGIAIAGYTVAASLPVLVALRLLTGVGEAGLFVGAATAIQDLAPASRRGEAASYFSVAIYGGLALGPALGEAVADARGYDAVWLLAAALCAVSAVLGWFTPIGDLAPPPTDGERRRLLHPAALLPGSVLGLSLIGFAGFSTFVPLYAEDIGLDGSRLVFILYAVVVLGVRVFGARVPDRFGPVPTASVALLCTASGLLLMAAWRQPAGLFAATVLFALGAALLFPSLMRLVVDGAPDAERSSAVATFSIFFDLSQGVGALALGGVVAVGGKPSAFVVGAVAAAGGLAVLRRRIAPLEGANPTYAATPAPVPD